jgi:hypothetical protein
MTKFYSQKWQQYFVKLLWNDPLIIPKERTKEEKVKAQSEVAAILGMAARTEMYYII